MIVLFVFVSLVSSVSLKMSGYTYVKNIQYNTLQVRHFQLYDVYTLHSYRKQRHYCMEFVMGRSKYGKYTE